MFRKWTKIKIVDVQNEASSEPCALGASVKMGALLTSLKNCELKNQKPGAILGYMKYNRSENIYNIEFTK